MTTIMYTPLSLHGNAGDGLTIEAILARRDVPELRELVELKQAGWKDEEVDKDFKAAREFSRPPSFTMLRNWTYNTKQILRVLDDVADFVPDTPTPLEFLDVGCAPGGFSFYILEKNAVAKGVGISLHLADGGLPMKPMKRHCSRYDFVASDVLRYDFSPADGPPLSPSPHAEGLQPIPAGWRRRFDLVLLDAHSIAPSIHWHAPSADPSPVSDADAARARDIYSTALLISQLLLAFETLAPGGTLVLSKLHRLAAAPAAHVLYLLDRLSAELVVHKPRSVHAARSTFYAVAKGVCPPGTGARGVEDLRTWYVDGLQRLWAELWLGGEEGRGRQRREGDLDFVVTTEVLLGPYLDRLVELGRDVWATQAEGLRELFSRNGVCG